MANMEAAGTLSILSQANKKVLLKASTDFVRKQAE